MILLSRTSNLRRASQAGFTLMELVMVIAILGVLTVMSIVPITNSIDESRFRETIDRLRVIRNAMIGDPDLTENNVRTSFGYLGDVGRIPTAVQGINALVTNPALPAWSLSAAIRVGAGWNGPYLSSAQAGTNFTLDGWNRAITYNPAANPPTLVSLGADGAAGGTGFNSDITVDIPPTLQTATINGFVSNNGVPYVGALQVDVNYPNGSGALTLTTDTLIPADNGYFSVANVPFGVRSVTVFRPSKAAPLQTLGPIVVTVDKSNFLVPSSVLELGIPGSTTCNNIGIITRTGAVTFANGNRTVTWRINVSTNVIFQKMTISSTRAATYNSLNPGGVTATCAGATRMYPCPANDDGAFVTVTPNFNRAAGNNITASAIFSTAMNGAGNMIVQYWHNVGCSSITVPL